MMGTQQAVKVDVDIRPHPDCPDTHSKVIVTTRRGMSYWCSWAGTPTEEQVRSAWREDRKAFGYP